MFHTAAVGGRGSAGKQAVYVWPGFSLYSPVSPGEQECVSLWRPWPAAAASAIEESDAATWEQEWIERLNQIIDRFSSGWCLEKKNSTLLPPAGAFKVATSGFNN